MFSDEPSLTKVRDLHETWLSFSRNYRFARRKRLNIVGREEELNSRNQTIYVKVPSISTL